MLTSSPTPSAPLSPGDSRSGPPSLPRLRSLYVSYLGLEDPLVSTQVVAYLEGLVRRGHVVHLLSFETTRLTAPRRRLLREQMASRGIAWHGLRYHQRPSLPTTVFDVICGAVYSTYLIRRHRLDAFHARAHVPAAMALLAQRLVGFRLIFDIRGLMAEEFEDAGRWVRGSAAFRLTKWVEGLAIARASGIVVLTERARTHLFGNSTDERVRVIPCCADIERIDALRGERERLRARLGLNRRPVLVYVGKLTGWYMEREMVEFFVRARESIDDLHFLVLTQGDHEPIESEFRRLGVGGGDRTITRVEPEAVGGYLAAADAAISFVRRSFSKIAASPTKVGEYLAAGLPVVCGAGIGDVDTLLAAYDVGLLLRDFDRASFDRAARELAKLLQDPEHAERSRRAARERLSLAGVGIPAYHDLYVQLAQDPRQV